MMTTQSRHTRILRILPGLGALAVLLVACGGQSEMAETEPATATVGSEELATEISARLTEQFDQEPDALHCPEDLPASEDATVTCALSDTDNVFDVTVTTTDVHGDTVNFDFEVAEEPRTTD